MVALTAISEPAPTAADLRDRTAAKTDRASAERHKGETPEAPLAASILGIAFPGATPL